MPHVEFKDNRIEVKQEINGASLKWLKEISAELTSQVAKNTRVDTGNTKRNWSHTIDEENGVAYVGNTEENALWEEFGTGAFAIHGDGRKGAWYVPVENYLGKKKPTYDGKVIIVYGKDKKAYYKTNGKKPNRPLAKAYTTEKQKARDLAEKIFKELNNK